MVKYPYAGKRFENRKGKTTPYSGDQLTSLFRSMLRIRKIETEIERRYHEDQMKTPVHLMIGQEAVSVGMCAALCVEDQLYCTHRTHGAYLAKGGDLKAMMSELYCRANGCVGSRGGSMHLIDKRVGMVSTSAIVGGILPIATGGALAAKMRKQKHATTVLFGEAANEEGVLYESLNFAVLKKLPIVYVCENNFYSVCSPLDKRQPVTEMHKRAAGFGLPAVAVDGTNVLDVYEAILEATARARRGDGPTYVEATTYRWRAHAGAGDDSASGYRDVSEREEWQNKACPIQTYRGYLEQIGVLEPSTILKMEKELDDEISAAFAHAIASANPTEEDLLKHVYAMG